MAPKSKKTIKVCLLLYVVTAKLCCAYAYSVNTLLGHTTPVQQQQISGIIGSKVAVSNQNQVYYNNADIEKSTYASNPGSPIANQGLQQQVHNDAYQKTPYLNPYNLEHNPHQQQHSFKYNGVYFTTNNNNQNNYKLTNNANVPVVHNNFQQQTVVGGNLQLLQNNVVTAAHSGFGNDHAVSIVSNEINQRQQEIPQNGGTIGQVVRQNSNEAIDHNRIIENTYVQNLFLNSQYAHNNNFPNSVIQNPNSNNGNYQHQFSNRAFFQNPILNQEIFTNEFSNTGIYQNQIANPSFRHNQLQSQGLFQNQIPNDQNSFQSQIPFHNPNPQEEFPQSQVPHNGLLSQPRNNPLNYEGIIRNPVRTQEISQSPNYGQGFSYGQIPIKNNIIGQTSVGNNRNPQYVTHDVNQSRIPTTENILQNPLTNEAHPANDHYHLVNNNSILQPTQTPTSQSTLGAILGQTREIPSPQTVDPLQKLSSQEITDAEFYSKQEPPQHPPLFDQGGIDNEEVFRRNPFPQQNQPRAVPLSPPKIPVTTDGCAYNTALSGLNGESCVEVKK